MAECLMACSMQQACLAIHLCLALEEVPGTHHVVTHDFTHDIPVIAIHRVIVYHLGTMIHHSGSRCLLVGACKYTASFPNMRCVDAGQALCI